MSKYILVVDEDDSLRHMLDTVLTTYGYRVSTDKGRDVPQLFERLRQETPDLIIVGDLEHKFDNLVLVHDLRDGFVGTHLPILIYSGWATKDDIAAGLASGADRYMTRPHETGAFTTCLAELLARAA